MSVSRYDVMATSVGSVNIHEFVEFCQKHLSHLDEVVLEFFQKDKAKEIIRSKVVQLFPKHEIDMFTNHFFGLIQFWAKTETDRLSRKPDPRYLPRGRLGVARCDTSSLLHRNFWLSVKISRPCNGLRGRKGLFDLSSAP